MSRGELKLRRMNVRIAKYKDIWRLMRIVLLFVLLVLLSGATVHTEAAELEGLWWYQAPEEQPAHLSGDLPADMAVWPGKWKSFDFPQSPALQKGQQTVWLMTMVSPVSPQSNILLFETTNQAVRVWLGKQLIYEQGDFSNEHFDEGKRLNVVPLPELSAETPLVFELYSDSSNHLGRFNMLFLDTETAQIQRFFFYDIPIVLAFPITVMMMLIVCYYYQYNPHGWKKLYIYIFLFLLVFSAWLISASNVKDLFIRGHVFWWYMLSILAYLLPLSANMILYELLKRKPYAHMGYIVFANAWLFVLAMAGEIMGYHTMNIFMAAYYPLIAVGEGLAFLWCIRAFRDGDELCRAVLVPTAAFTFFGVIDGLSGHFYLLPWRTFTTPIAIYAFMYFVIEILRQQLCDERELAMRTAGLEYEAVMAAQRSSLDALTGCWNRSKLNTLLAMAISRSRQTNRAFSVLLLDIDHFKQVNDRYGHDAGDAVLKGFAAVIRQQLGNDGQCIRWGGEEFLVLVSENTLAVEELAEQLREQVESSNIAGHEITCSIGAAYWHGKKDTPDALFKRVDRALYAAKEAGRNQVRFADPEW